MTEKHIYPFGIIGNCSYMSYIDENASVVWQCWPHFDSSFIFGKLVSEKKGGEFSIMPSKDFKSHQYYVENTNILVTHFKASDGEFKVVDFAPRFELYERYHRPLMLFRKIELISGTPQIKVICTPKGNYGEIEAESIYGSNSIDFGGLDADVRLTTTIAKSSIVDQKSFVLSKNHYLVLSWGKPLEASLERTYEEFYERTQSYWRK